MVSIFVCAEDVGIHGSLACDDEEGKTTYHDEEGGDGVVLGVKEKRRRGLGVFL